MLDLVSSSISLGLILICIINVHRSSRLVKKRFVQQYFLQSQKTHISKGKQIVPLVNLSHKCSHSPYLRKNVY